MSFITRNLGRMRNSLRLDASCCLWQLCYYSRNFEIVEDVVFTLHATFDDISRLITKYSPETVVIVHSVDDRENKYDNKLSNRFPDKNIIYADDNTIYDLMKEGMIYDKQKVR